MENPDPKSITCAFTGHRPEKLPWGDNESDPECAALKNRIYHVCRELYERGYRHFVCGMARGADFYFCEAVLRLKESCEGVVLIAAVPFRGQASSWGEADRARYEDLLSRCDRVAMLEDEYSDGCYIRRNRRMVDVSSALMAVLAGGGGTKSTVDYAMRRGLELIIFDPRSDVYVDIPPRFDLE
ncbi:MAG: DUF1273 family protein [Oscillospiraceae bacterium]|nr:DUF1273 family protein [Oscillospiraceae bacterium]